MNRLSDAGSIPARSIQKAPYLRCFLLFMSYIVVYHIKMWRFFAEQKVFTFFFAFSSLFLIHVHKSYINLCYSTVIEKIQRHCFKMPGNCCVAEVSADKE